MRRMTNPLVFATCLSLLSLQWSGVHVHADDTGILSVPETPYTHRHTDHDRTDAHHHRAGSAHRDDHGHERPVDEYNDARDVPLLGLALGIFDLPLVLLGLVLLWVVIPQVRTLASPIIVYAVLSGRYTRWRPPLRAPPQPA